MILNPASGKGGAKAREEVEEALKHHAASYRIEETTPERGAGEIAREAVADGATEIVVGGGDGTVMAAVNGIGAGSRANLAILPLGTANLIAAGLGLPRRLPAAIEAALDAEPRAVDLGRCGEEFFVLGAGLGIAECFIRDTDSHEKKLLGPLAYVYSMCGEIGTKACRYEISLDDGPARTEWAVAIVVVNIANMGGRVRFAPGAKLDDGMLDICLLRRFGLGDAARMGWCLLRGRPDDCLAADFLKARRIEIVADPPHRVQLDGDPGEIETPVTIEAIRPGIAIRGVAADAM